MDTNNTKHSIFFKMIRLDNVLKLFAVLVCMLIISSSAFAVEVIGTLLYWESDGSDIRKFLNTTPYIYAETLGGYMVLA